MADVISAIKASGGDYATIAAWMASVPSNIGSDTYIGELYSEDYTETVDIANGVTSSAGGSVILRAATGHAFEGTPATAANQHARIIGPGTSSIALSVDSDLVALQTATFIVQGIEIVGSATDFRDTARLTGSLGAETIRLTRCCINHSSNGASGSDGIETASAGSMTVIVDNCLIINQGSHGINFNSHPASGLIYNCVVVDCAQVAASNPNSIRIVTGTNVTIRNTYAGAPTLGTGAAIVPASANVDYCASEDTSATGSNSHTSVPFADYFNADYSRKAYSGGGTDVLGDGGTDLGATYATDIAGATRTGTWDIGAEEFGANVPPILTVTTPAEGATYLTTQQIAVSASATDAEDDDAALTATIEYSIDGGGWTTIGGSGNIPAQSAGSKVITFRVTDSGGASDTVVRNVTIATVTANAGTDYTAAAMLTTTLSGVAQSVSPSTISWTQVRGVPITFTSGSATATPTFTVPWFTYSNIAYEVDGLASYRVGQIISVASVRYLCVQSGTQGGSDPGFTATVGAQTTDGTVIWESIGTASTGSCPIVLKMTVDDGVNTAEDTVTITAQWQKQSVLTLSQQITKEFWDTALIEFDYTGTPHGKLTGFGSIYRWNDDTAPAARWGGEGDNPSLVPLICWEEGGGGNGTGTFIHALALAVEAKQDAADYRRLKKLVDSALEVQKACGRGAWYDVAVSSNTIVPKTVSSVLDITNTSAIGAGSFDDGITTSMMQGLMAASRAFAVYGDLTYARKALFGSGTPSSPSSTHGVYALLSYIHNDLRAVELLAGDSTKQYENGGIPQVFPPDIAQGVTGYNNQDGPHGPYMHKKTLNDSVLYYWFAFLRTLKEHFDWMGSTGDAANAASYSTHAALCVSNIHVHAQWCVDMVNKFGAMAQAFAVGPTDDNPDTLEALDYPAWARRGEPPGITINELNWAPVLMSLWDAGYFDSDATLKADIYATGTPPTGILQDYMDRMRPLADASVAATTGIPTWPNGAIDYSRDGDVDYTEDPFFVVPYRTKAGVTPRPYCATFATSGVEATDQSVAAKATLDSIYGSSVSDDAVLLFSDDGHTNQPPAWPETTTFKLGFDATLANASPPPDANLFVAQPSVDITTYNYNVGFSYGDTAGVPTATVPSSGYQWLNGNRGDRAIRAEFCDGSGYLSVNRTGGAGESWDEWYWDADYPPGVYATSPAVASAINAYRIDYTYKYADSSGDRLNTTFYSGYLAGLVAGIATLPGTITDSDGDGIPDAGDISDNDSELKGSSSEPAVARRIRVMNHSFPVPNVFNRYLTRITRQRRRKEND